MNRTIFRRGSSLALLLGVLATASDAPDLYSQELLVPRGSLWKYWDGASSPGPDWTATGHDDSGWRSGPAQLGYGDNDERTLIGYGPAATNRFLTAYFRHRVSVPDPSRFGGLRLRLLRDDGAAVYLNGAEIFRSNLPAGALTSQTAASSGVSGAAESTFLQTDLEPHGLVPGDNVLAVEVHQNTSTSSDLSFDLELEGVYPPISVSLNAPASDEAGVAIAPTLQATVTHPRGQELTVSFQGRLAGPAPGPDFTLIALPDTQNYVSSKSGGTPAHFTAQTDWILANRISRNIVFVTQLGDCVQNGDNGGDDTEWQHATNAMYRLEDPLTTLHAHGLPYGIAVGNHDQSPFGDASGSTTFYNQYFGEPHFAGRDYYGGHHGTNNNNHYELFSASGLDFIVVHLEYDTTPEATVLQWADQLLKTHARRRAIVVSHWIINAGFNASFGAQGQAIYDALKPNPNLFLMLCGHVNPEEGQRTDVYNGSTVYTLMSDYQNRANGGDGWLRILEFSPSNNVIRVKTYSPTLDRFETDADSEFVLPYDQQNGSGEFSTLATHSNVPSGSPLLAPWLGLSPSSRYEWRVTATDGLSTTISPLARFTTIGSGGTTGPNPHLDTDGDRVSDAQEALAGTDPRDPTSVLHITSLRYARGQFELGWSSVPGKVYRVCFSRTLDAAVWTDCSPEIEPAGESAAWAGTVPMDATTGFFAIRLVR